MNEAHLLNRVETNMKKKIYVTQASMPDYNQFIEKIKPLWDSHYLTNMGVLHKELEEKLKCFLDVPEFSLMVNGHLSLELAIQAMNFPRGSEVITTPFTFISTTHAIIRNGLIPIFCDIKMDDYTIDEKKIEELITEKTVAILPVHVYGNICAVEKIEQIARKYNIKVIYDAAHAFGEKYNGRGIGNYGDISIFSFHATKVFNTIEGGGVVCRQHELYEILYNLKNFGIRSEELVTQVGANAKMNEFQAAMGLCNMEYINSNILKRKYIVERYRKLLGGIEGIRLMEEKEEVEYNYAYFPVLFESEKCGLSRDFFYDTLKQNDIFSRKYFYPLTSDQACFKNRYKNIKLDNARYCADRILVLPLYPELDEKDVETISNIILQNI